LSDLPPDADAWQVGELRFRTRNDSPLAGPPVRYAKNESQCPPNDIVAR
jgi:hypothetical protein